MNTSKIKINCYVIPRAENLVIIYVKMIFNKKKLAFIYWTKITLRFTFFYNFCYAAKFLFSTVNIFGIMLEKFGSLLKKRGTGKTRGSSSVITNPV